MLQESLRACLVIFQRLKTPVCINLHLLPFKARIGYEICLLTYKALRFGEPRYLADLLTTFSTETDMNLSSIEFADLLPKFSTDMSLDSIEFADF